MHVKTLDLLSRRPLENPVVLIMDKIPLFVASDIRDRDVVVKNVETWCKTKGLMLDNVTRIDVIARHPSLDYLGKYDLFFSGIILTWPASPPRGIKLWGCRLGAEFTFYHEVGHHASGHIEGGQVAEQEKEADEYARTMIRSSRPVLMLIGRVLLWPLKPLLKRITASFDRAAS